MAKFFLYYSSYIYDSYKYLLNYRNITDSFKDRLKLILEKPISGYIDYNYAEEIHIRFNSLRDIYEKLWEQTFNYRDVDINLIRYDEIV